MATSAVAPTPTKTPPDLITPWDDRTYGTISIFFGQA